MADPEVISADAVAKLLGINVKTVYAAAAAGEIPARRLGRRFLFVRGVIEAWLTSAPEAPPPARSPTHTTKATRPRNGAAGALARPSLPTPAGQARVAQKDGNA